MPEIEVMQAASVSPQYVTPRTKSVSWLSWFWYAFFGE